MPVYQPGGPHGNKDRPKGTSYSTVQLPGSTTYVPYTTSVSDKWLSLKVIDGKDYRDSGTTTDVWIGEASVTGEGMDLRDMINYLVVGIFDHFGENTGRKIPVNIPQDDRGFGPSRRLNITRPNAPTSLPCLPRCPVYFSLQLSAQSLMSYSKSPYDLRCASSALSLST